MKHVAILLAALVLVLGVHSFTRADAPAGVQKWEYKSLGAFTGQGWSERFLTALNREGADGWELVATEKVVLLRRPAK